MTPLARRIMKDLTLKPSKREMIDHVGFISQMTDIHCFEVSEVHPLVNDLLNKAIDETRSGGRLSTVRAAAAETSFLPAPRTWLEFERDGSRHGYLLIEKGHVAEVFWVLPDEGGRPIATGPYTMGLAGAGGVLSTLELQRAGVTDRISFALAGIAVALNIFLALINTPRIIGRQQHMPDASLERRMLKHRRAIGHFPLHAWTEIKLKVHAPANLSDEEPVEAHLTGQRALHFCRAHLRIKGGRVELVKAHWRGDASLGIKRSRYMVTT